jgi:hypothetical protein
MGPAAAHTREPLTAREMEPLWRWERQVGWLHIAAMGAFLLASVAGQREGLIASFSGPLLAGVLVLLLVAAVLQLRARCPRCQSRLRARILRMLPDKCSACGVEFPRPPRA